MAPLVGQPHSLIEDWVCLYVWCSTRIMKSYRHDCVRFNMVRLSRGTDRSASSLCTDASHERMPKAARSQIRRNAVKHESGAGNHHFYPKYYDLVCCFTMIQIFNALKPGYIFYSSTPFIIVVIYVRDELCLNFLYRIRDQVWHRLLLVNLSIQKIFIHSCVSICKLKIWLFQKIRQPQ